MRFSPVVERRAATLARSAPEQVVALDEAIERRCRRTEVFVANADRNEGARLAPTVFSFEVLD